jgi:hypothetical protein
MQVPCVDISNIPYFSIYLKLTLRVLSMYKEALNQDFITLVCIGRKLFTRRIDRIKCNEYGNPLME